MSNPAVERDSQQAALVGAFRAMRSGCPSLPRSESPLSTHSKGSKGSITVNLFLLIIGIYQEHRSMLCLARNGRPEIVFHTDIYEGTLTP